MDTQVAEHFSTFNVKTEYLSVCSLKQLCGKILISDIYYVKIICSTYVPKTILCYLLSLAINEERILSVSHLLQYYPEEVLVLTPNFLPLKSILKCHRLEGYAFQEIIPLCPIYLLILRTFCDIIQGKYSNSKLQKLDLKEIPFNFSYLKSLWNVILNASLEERTCKYVLRLNLIIHDYSSLLQLCSLKRQLKQTKTVKLQIVGLHFNHCAFSKSKVTNMLDDLELFELQYFSFYFCEIGSPSVFSKMQTFYNLKAIDISYAGIDFTTNFALLDGLSKSLHELVHISHINLRYCKISNCLDILFQQYCKNATHTSKNQRTENQRCCPAHRAKLQYLNLSNSYPKSKDLLYLSTSPLSKSLLYLNLSYHKVDVNSITSLLTSLASTLITLDLSHVIHNHVKLDFLFPLICSMVKLRYVSLVGIHFEENYILSKVSILGNISTLWKISISVPSGDIEIPISKDCFKCEKQSENMLEFYNNHL